MSWAGTHCLLPDVDVRDYACPCCGRRTFRDFRPCASTRLDLIAARRGKGEFMRSSAPALRCITPATNT